MESTFISTDPDAEHFYHIGQFLHAFSQLEFSIKVRVASIFGPSNEDFLLMIEDIEVRKILNNLARYCRKHDLAVDITNNIDEICKEFNKLGDQRNIIAHALWAGGVNGPMAALKQTNNRKQHERERCFSQSSEIQKLTEQCRNLMQRVLSLSGF